MRRGVIEVEIVLLHVLAMVPFLAVESEESFLQYGVAFIPES
jgi:hypothetical protein